jgi:thiosulfate/3-mercaptopyruvate sulfurtransferase
MKYWINSMKYWIIVMLIAAGAFAFRKYEERRVMWSEPWNDSQLIKPADLAAAINSTDAKKPIVICVGPGALIKGSVDMGPAKEKQNLEKLKQYLAGLPKDANIVIYCGCCPFEHCPNIRPAFSLLNEMKLTNDHLLNIEHNIKTDWIDKGYPAVKN